MAEVPQVETGAFLAGVGAMSRTLGRVRAILRWVLTDTPIVFWISLDVIYSVLALILAAEYSPQVGKWEASTFEFFAFSVSVLVGGLTTGLYERRISRSYSQLIAVHLSASLVTGTVFALTVSVVEFGKVGRWIWFLAVAIHFLCALISRVPVLYILRKYPIRILMIGKDRVNSPIPKRLETEPYHYRMVSWCDVDEGVLPQEPTAVGAIRVSPLQEVPSLCRDQGIDVIIIATGLSNHSGVLKTCFEALPSGCLVIDECTFYEEVFEQVLVDHINEGWFYSSKINLSRRLGYVTKRVMDIVLSILGLTVFLILFPLLWILIRLSSYGPAIYSAVRCGQFGKEFKIHKLRTMFEGSDADGELWTQKGDRRITPLGKILRRIHLDEIPQLYNVLIGEMSLVGPRPDSPEMHRKVEAEVPYFYFRLWARPGLTGLAQIRFGYSATVEEQKEKLQYDLYYIKNWSLFLDVQVLFRTILALMRRTW
jgi:exopolysaccharide biosynthesis polyprenyl glycosylphosphotransferase